MSLQINKKGVSVIIGYVLLVSMVVVMGAIVYQNLKTYIPGESLECQSGVSLAIKEISCTKNTGNIFENTFKLNITLKNTGRFDIDEYLIKASETSNNIATVDLSGFNSAGSGGKVIFQGGLGVNKEEEDIYDKINSLLDIKKIEIIPIKYKEIDGVLSPIICNNARTLENVICPQVAGSDNGNGDDDECESLGFEICNDGIDNDCDDSTEDNDEGCINCNEQDLPPGELDERCNITN